MDVPTPAHRGGLAVGFVSPAQHTICELGNYNFNRIKTYFLLNGYQEADWRTADNVVINTCGFHSDQVRDSESIIDEVLAAVSGRTPMPRIIVFGCLPAIVWKYPDDVTKAVVVIGPKETGRLDEIVGGPVSIAEVGNAQIGQYGIRSYQDYLQEHAGEWVEIGQGCNGSCSYCTIRLAKGRPTSRTVEAVVDDVRRHASAGRFLITLLADDCASWGADLGLTFPDLLDAVCAVDQRLAFNVYYYFPATLVRDRDRLKPHVERRRIRFVNVPMQSGSPRVLQLMQRRYDPKQVAETIRKLRALDPDLQVNGHFIVGFPTETREDLADSLEVCGVYSEVRFFAYSQNERTPAAKLSPGVEREEMTRRKYAIESYLAENRISGKVTNFRKELEPLPPGGLIRLRLAGGVRR